MRSGDYDHDYYYHDQDNCRGHDHYDIQYDDNHDHDDNERSALVAVGTGRNKCQTNLDTTLNDDVLMLPMMRMTLVMTFFQGATGAKKIALGSPAKSGKGAIFIFS